MSDQYVTGGYGIDLGGLRMQLAVGRARIPSLIVLALARVGYFPRFNARGVRSGELPPAYALKRGKYPHSREVK